MMPTRLIFASVPRIHLTPSHLCSFGCPALCHLAPQPPLPLRAVDFPWLLPPAACQDPSTGQGCSPEMCMMSTAGWQSPHPRHCLDLRPIAGASARGSRVMWWDVGHPKAREGVKIGRGGNWSACAVLSGVGLPSTQILITWMRGHCNSHYLGEKSIFIFSTVITLVTEQIVISWELVHSHTYTMDAEESDRAQPGLGTSRKKKFACFLRKMRRDFFVEKGELLWKERENHVSRQFWTALACVSGIQIYLRN